ncbi:MAG: tetratricopeptide repeat protein, partial [Pyrinomonadaceae bacterium]
MACAVTAFLILSIIPPTPAAATVAPSAETDVKQADAALLQGRGFLRRNRADQALPLFESALEMYTRANSRPGIAAAEESLGDIYTRQGQYEEAITRYRSALSGARALGDLPRANLLLAKIGETAYLAGDAAASQAAFAEMLNQSRKPGAGGMPQGDSNGSSDRQQSMGVSFAAVSLAVPGLAACSALNPNSVDSSSNNGSNPSQPQNMGHAPKGLDGIGRMDLRVVDQDGNPVKGARAKLNTKRPNGIDCECFNDTDEIGRAVMNPIHVGKVLKLVVKAKGFETLEQIVDPAQMAGPYKVVMQAKGAAKAASSAAGSAASAAASAAACLGLYSLFNSYSLSQLGLGRLNFDGQRLGEARQNFQNVLAAADPKGPVGNLAAARLYRAVSRTNLGDVAFKQGRYAEALKFYTEAAEGARQDGRPELVWGALRGVGKSQWAQAAQESDPQRAAKNREEALKAYRASLAAIETLLEGSVRADEARAHFLSTTREVFDEAAAAYAEMALMSQTSAHAGPLGGQALAYATDGFRISEQGRARSLLELLGVARAEVTEGVPAQLLERKGVNLARQQEIAETLLSTNPATPGQGAQPQQPRPAVADLEAELERLTVEYNSIENQIRTSNPRYAQLTRTAPLGLEEVRQQVLDADTMMLAYRLGENNSYLWAMTRDELRLFKLPARDDIDAQVIAMREQMIPSGARRALIRSEAGLRGLLEEVQAITDERGLKLGGQASVAQAVQEYERSAHQLFNT